MRITIIAHNVDPKSLEVVPGIDVIAETSDADSLNQSAATLCDVVLCDVDHTVLAEFEEIVRLFPSARLVGLVSESTNAFSVIEAQNCGCVEFVRKPVDAEHLAEVLQRTAGEGHHQGKTICVIGASGGAGATTIACNLAVALKEMGKVGLIDADLTFGGVSQYFDTQPGHTLADVCGCEQIDMVTLESAMEETSSGVHVLGRPDHVSERHKITPGKVAAVIHTASGMYHYTVIDLPRQLDDMVGHIMLRSTLVLVITETNVGSVNNAKRISSALVEEGLPRDRVAVVLNRAAKRTPHAVTPADVGRIMGSVYAVIPNDFPAALHASDRGMPIASTSPIHKAIHDMALRIAGRQEEHPQTRSRFRRLLKGGVS